MSGGSSPVPAEEAIRELEAMPPSPLELHAETRLVLIRLLRQGKVEAMRDARGRLLYQVASLPPLDGQCRRRP